MSKITNNGLTQPGTRCFIAMIMLGLTDAARLKHNVVVSRGHCRGGRCLSLCEYNGLQSCVCDKGFCGCFFFGSAEFLTRNKNISVFSHTSLPTTRLGSSIL